VPQDTLNDAVGKCHSQEVSLSRLHLAWPNKKL
jgi:hypothetical protein